MKKVVQYATSLAFSAPSRRSVSSQLCCHTITMMELVALPVVCTGRPVDDRSEDAST